MEKTKIRDIYTELLENKRILKNLMDITHAHDTLSNELMEQILKFDGAFKSNGYKSYSVSNIIDLIPQEIRDLIHKSYIDIDKVEQAITKLHKQYNSNNYEYFDSFIHHVYLCLEKAILRLKSYI